MDGRIARTSASASSSRGKDKQSHPEPTSKGPIQSDGVPFKPASVLTDIMGPSGRAVLDALHAKALVRQIERLGFSCAIAPAEPVSI